MIEMLVWMLPLWIFCIVFIEIPTWRRENEFYEKYGDDAE